MAAACDRCGAHVSTTYYRVNAVEGILHGCINCTPKGTDKRPDDARGHVAWSHAPTA